MNLDSSNQSQNWAYFSLGIFCFWVYYSLCCRFRWNNCRKNILSFFFYIELPLFKNFLWSFRLTCLYLLLFFLGSNEKPKLGIKIIHSRALTVMDNS